MNNRQLLALLVSAIVATGVVGCTQQVEDGPAGLLRQHGWHPLGDAQVSEVVVGDHGDLPWLLYQEASERIGLSLPSTGTAGRLVTFQLRAERPLSGHVLLVDDTIAGAWLSNGSVPGIFALDEPPN